MVKRLLEYERRKSASWRPASFRYRHRAEYPAAVMCEFFRVARKCDLLSELRRRRKWQQVHRYKKLLNRQFHADRPNSKWLTDISYIHTKQGVLYLSMIRDLYDNSIVVYKTGAEQTVNLVLDTIRLAMKQEKRGNPYDNAMEESFFSSLKTECIYRHKPATFSEANEMIDSYIHFYNNERIQLKTGEAPLARRLSV